MSRVLFTCVLLLLTIVANAQCIADDPNSPACNALISTDPRNNAAINNERISRKNRFNWMASSFNVYHPSGGYSGGITGTPYNLVNPYHTIEPFLSGINYYNFPLNARTPEKLDFYPEDGWELIHKGNGYKVDETSYAPTEESRVGPYFILYNKYTSTLRVLAGFKNIGVNQVIVASIKHNVNSTNPNLKFSGLFNKYSEVISPLDQQTNIPNVEQGSPSPISGDMFYADFRVNYDPCICNYESTLGASFKVKNTGVVNLGGRLLGTQVPLDGSGNSQLLNGRDFLTSVYKKGFDIKGGQLTYSNIDKLVEKYKQPEQDLFTKLALGLLGSILKSAVGPLDNILGKASTELLTKNFGGTNIAGFKLPDTLNVAFGAIGKATDQFSASLTSENKIPNIGFIEAEMALSGTVNTGTDLPNTTIEISQPGSKGTNDSTRVPDRYYPAYNEALGTFAVLETPIVQTFVNRAGCGNPRDPVNPIMSFKFDQSALKFYYNPAAEVDESKTRIYGALEFKLPNYQYYQINGISVSGANFVSTDSLGRRTFVTNFFPIESLYRIVPSISLPCAGPRDIIVNLRLQIFYEFKENKFGKKNRHWEILTFPTKFTPSQTAFTENLNKLPKSITIGSTFFSTNTTLVASDQIILNGNITTAPGVTVTFNANDVSITSSGSIPSNARMLIGVPNVYNDGRLSSVAPSYVKVFCSSTGKYKAKELDPAARVETKEELANSTKTFEKELIAFPNPSTGQVSFQYSIETPTHVKLSLINVTGSTVATIIDEYQEVGAHEATYDASYLPVGVYVYTLETKAGKENRRLVLIK